MAFTPVALCYLNIHEYANYSEVKDPLITNEPFLFHQSSEDVALDELAGDFVAPTRASKVCSAASAPTTTDTQVNVASLLSVSCFVAPFMLF